MPMSRRLLQQPGCPPYENDEEPEFRSDRQSVFPDVGHRFHQQIVGNVMVRFGSTRGITALDAQAPVFESALIAGSLKNPELVAIQAGLANRLHRCHRSSKILVCGRAGVVALLAAAGAVQAIDLRPTIRIGLFLTGRRHAVVGHLVIGTRSARQRGDASLADEGAPSVDQCVACGGERFGCASVFLLPTPAVLGDRDSAYQARFQPLDANLLSQFAVGIFRLGIARGGVQFVPNDRVGIVEADRVCWGWHRRVAAPVHPLFLHAGPVEGGLHALRRDLPTAGRRFNSCAVIDGIRFQAFIGVLVLPATTDISHVYCHTRDSFQRCRIDANAAGFSAVAGEDRRTAEKHNNQKNP